MRADSRARCTQIVNQALDIFGCESERLCSGASVPPEVGELFVLNVATQRIAHDLALCLAGRSGKRFYLGMLVVCQATFAVLMRRFSLGLLVLWLRQWMYRRMRRAWVAWSGWSVPASVKYRSARNCASILFSQEA